MRTSKFKIIVRATVIVFVIYMLLAWMWNSITMTNFWKPWEMLISAVLTVFLFGGFSWLITNFAMALAHGRDPEYRRWKENGGDPYFDSLPWPINPDSKLTRETGIRESRTSFVPPADWQFQCPACGARVQHRIDVCLNCGYGNDGDSSKYFQMFGDEKPDDISDEEWQEIRKRHGR